MSKMIAVNITNEAQYNEVANYYGDKFLAEYNFVERYINTLEKLIVDEKGIWDVLHESNKDDYEVIEFDEWQKHNNSENKEEEKEDKYYWKNDKNEWLGYDYTKNNYKDNIIIFQSMAAANMLTKTEIIEKTSFNINSFTQF